jgi:2-dehydropantoate 2-reductase
MSECRVAVVGPGAIGGAFAAAVQQTGYGDLVLCARRPLDELVVDRDDGDSVVVSAPVLTDPAAVDNPVDWVLLAVKAHQTEEAGGWLRTLAGPGSVVVVLQNGVEHCERVRPLAGEAMVLPAIVRCSAEPSGPGHIRLYDKPRLIVPAGPESQVLAKLMAVGAQVDLTEDFTTELWRKLCSNAVAGLMVLAGRRAGIFRNADVAALARGLVAECLAVARAEGAQLPDSIVDTVVAGYAAMSADRGSSIVYDREAGRPLEWDARNGVIRRLGARHGIPTPISDVIVPLLAVASTAQ